MWVVPVSRKNVLPSSEAETLPLRWGRLYILCEVGMTMNLRKGGANKFFYTGDGEHDVLLGLRGLTG